MEIPEARLPRWLRLGLTVVLVAAVAGAYLWFVRRNCGHYAGGSDSSGYMNLAKMARSGWVGTVPRIEGLTPPAWDYGWQQPLGFSVEGATGRMVPTYPVGIALHYVVASLFVDPDFAPLLTDIALAVAAALLIAELGRTAGLPLAWCGLAVAMLWACPIFVFMDLQPMSDVAALVWVTAAVLFAWKSRGRAIWAVASGGAFSIAVLVRPTDGLALLPCLLAMGWRPKRWLAGLLGGLPAAVFLGWYNERLFGAVFTTGYGDISEIVGLHFVPHNAWQFFRWFLLLLTPVTIGAAVLFLGRRGEEPCWRRVFANWIGVLLVFYLSYAFSGDGWWYMRFLLPIVPAIIVCSLIELRRLWGAHRHIGLRRWALIAAIGSIVPGEIVACHVLDVTGTKPGERNYLRAAEWTRTHLPANAIVVAMQTSGALTYYTDFPTVNWLLITPDGWVKLTKAAREAHRPIYACLFDFEEPEVLRGKTKGPWQKVTSLPAVTIWKLEEDR